MKVVKPRSEFLSNYEVLRHLKGIQKKNNWVFSDKDKKESNKRHRDFGGVNLEMVVKDSLQYLESSPCGVIGSIDSFKQLMIFLNQFELMKAEKLQIVNTLPRSMVLLYALVEECDQRFSEAESELIIEKINELYPVEEEAEGEEDGEEAEEAEEVEGEDVEAEADN
ncbi:uncharacterized protein KQ657_000921 [Scheffersomyces spartinae]|uniref:DNA-directed RNA polymerase III subunit RPC9 n=1 Tax=Scheffersomyces spartinae TaxID=45513 RepID=A0A9P8AHB7_9ASCO|nr:uncharacterized protein KQ657_000921 [Scheffersomyces spartinae]KAG7193167.1 hypothetical protein KQ657_000921 [Scheffersomyces spartinae]